jgi:hypothetical protein
MLSTPRVKFTAVQALRTARGGFSRTVVAVLLVTDEAFEVDLEALAAIVPDSGPVELEGYDCREVLLPLRLS